MVRLSVTFLGTSSAAPTEARGLPAMAVQREGELVIMDCGEGIQRQIIQLGLGLNRETTILITHLHGDHVTGLLGLLQTMSMAQRSRPLTLVAPGGLATWLKATAETLHMGLTFELRFIPAKPGLVLKTPAFLIRAARADHSVEAFSYLLEERRRPGVFFPGKARRLGVPEGRLWSRLQRGRQVKVGDKVVRPEQVSGPPRPGRRIGYSGDTRPSKRLATFFRRADLIIFDSTFSAADKSKAIERKHSTCVEAAGIAKAASARRLVLTHFSARYKSVSRLVREARAVFPATDTARDGLVFDVPYPGS